MLKLQSVKRKFHWFELLSSSCASAVITALSLNIHFTLPTNLWAKCSWHGPDWLIDILCVALMGTVAAMTWMSADLSSLSLSLSTPVGLCGKRVHSEQCGVTPLTPFANYSLCDPQQREQEIHLPIRGHKHARPALKLYTCSCVSASHAPAKHWCLRKLSQLIFCPKC